MWSRWCTLGQGDEILGSAKDQARSARHVHPVACRIAHAPVQADAVAIHAVACRGYPLIDFGVGPASLGKASMAKLGVEHEPSLSSLVALVFTPARIPKSSRKGQGLTATDVASRPPSASRSATGGRSCSGRIEARPSVIILSLSVACLREAVNSGTDG